MEFINYDEFAEDLNKYNTFIVDGQLCLGAAVTRNYKDCGISILADFNHLKWIIREWQIEHIIKIEKDTSGSRHSYRVILDGLPPKKIVCYNRKDIESIPAEDCGTNFLKLLDKDIFDDTISFFVKGDWHSAAVIGLDLRKLRLNNQQKCKIAKELRKTSRLLDSPPKNDISETLCLVVEIEDYSFTFQGLDVNTLEFKPLYISDDFHNHEKVKEYIQIMTNSYKTAHKNIETKTDLMMELSELTSSISIT